jgi:DNA replicative helicase MCM subunit Mcm2 (Cdc46/Mcm family)
MQKTYIDAFHIEKDKINFREFMLSEDMLEKVNDIKRSMSEEELFLKMSRSICPEIFGMEEVK